MKMPSFSTPEQQAILKEALLASLVYNGFSFLCFNIGGEISNFGGLFYMVVASFWAGALAMVILPKSQRGKAIQWMFNIENEHHGWIKKSTEVEFSHVLVLTLLCSPFTIWAMKGFGLFLLYHWQVMITMAIYMAMLHHKGFLKR